MTAPARTLPPPYRQLAAADPVLAGLIDGATDFNDDVQSVSAGASGADAFETNFAALVLHILGQQLSIRSTMAIFARLQACIGGPPTPAALASISQDTYRGVGVSHQKASALRDLAERHLDGSLDVEHLSALDDDEAIHALTEVKGIGRWTAEMFLIHQLHRDDVLPAGDVGVRKAIQLAYGLPELPNEEQVRRLGHGWAPHRTLATQLLWASLPPRSTAVAPSAALGSLGEPTPTVMRE